MLITKDVKQDVLVGLRLLLVIHGNRDLFGRLVQAGFNCLPVDNVPDGSDVFGTQILVVQVVSMLPDINSEKRLQSSGGFQRILISAGGNFESASFGVVSKPAPSTSLDCNGSGTHLVLHGIDTSETFGNFGFQSAARTRRVRGHFGLRKDIMMCGMTAKLS